VTFAGSPDRVEARLVPEAGFELDSFRISGLPRRPGLAQARAVLLAGSAPLACARIIRRRRPDVVLGGGGYVAGPMVFAAALRRLPTAVMEADAHLGLANRIASPFARRIFLAYPIRGREDGKKYRVVGRPIPGASRPWPRAEARQRLELPAEGPALLVFGGSQGSRALNELAVESFGAFGPTLVHVCGESHYEALRARVSRADYRLLAWVPEFGAALGACDLVLARAGGSVFEVAAAALPAVLVPYPFATGDHQTANARHFAAGGGAIVVPEAELGRVPELVRSLLDDPPRRAAMSEAMRALARPDAAELIAEEVVALARSRR
jgi:UDP-N-acetylglucosamine--N-acetylmuramyl-(pentapeptide) pyrophosphoryl-undecaprenol N-acetylglucosamine transferase